MARTREIKSETDAAAQPEPLVVSRHFAAPRELVFKAWSSAEHIKRWFSPEGCSVPEAEVEFRAGGVFAVRMHLPTGEDHWARGAFDEVMPPDRLAFTAGVSFGGKERFTVHTVVTFEDDGIGTRMTVTQAYDIHDPAFLSAVDGSAEGWRTTLDKLEREVARIAAAEPRSVVHAIFSLERVYDASPALVFRALSDPAAKARWFEGGGGWAVIERTMDVRPGRPRTCQGAMAERPRHDVRRRLLRRRGRPAARLLLRVAPRRAQDFGLARHHRARAGGRRHAAQDHRAGRVPRRLRRCGFPRARNRPAARSPGRVAGRLTRNDSQRAGTFTGSEKFSVHGGEKCALRSS